MSTNNRKKGEAYEDVAASYLSSKGYSILDRNYRKRGGEIDIVAQKDMVLVFCEVKYRRNLRSGNPLEAVDFRKQQKISRMAAHYLLSRGHSLEEQIRFDVIGISGDGMISHIENAFEYCYDR